MVSEIGEKKNYSGSIKITGVSDSKDFEVWEAKDGNKLVHNCETIDLNNSRKIRRHCKKLITNLTNLIR